MRHAPDVPPLGVVAAAATGMKFATGADGAALLPRQAIGCADPQVDADGRAGAVSGLRRNAQGAILVSIRWYDRDVVPPADTFAWRPVPLERMVARSRAQAAATSSPEPREESAPRAVKDNVNVATHR